jgi:CubicO group peptidase (beta-lactamase class C family)
VFGEVLRRKLEGRRQNPLQYLEARILDPIGCRHGEWVHDGVGNPHLPNGCFISAREWAKYGWLALNRGRHAGTQIVDEGLFAETLQPSQANAGFGLNWWLNTPGGFGSAVRQRAPEGSAGGFIYNDGRTDLFAALGAGRNGLYIIPSLRMVVVRQIQQAMELSEEDAPPADRQARRGGFSDHQFMGRVLEGA